MKSQKRFLVVLILSALTFLFPSIASAVNPANWSFYLESYGSRAEDGPTSTFIDTGYSQYPYDWALTGVEARLVIDQQWYDVFDGIPVGDKSGSGVLGALPVINELVHQIDTPEIAVDIFVSVDASGYATLAIDNITFGQALGYQIDGIKCWVDVTVIPEPCTLLLVGLGVVILRKCKS